MTDIVICCSTFSPTTMSHGNYFWLLGYVCKCTYIFVYTLTYDVTICPSIWSGEDILLVSFIRFLSLSLFIFLNTHTLPLRVSSRLQSLF